VIILVSGVAVLAEVYGDLLRAAGATERLMELLATESPIRSPASPRALPAAIRGSSLSLEAVTFRYPSRPKDAALKDFSLQVAAGETVALVGPSGAGKSTVFQLLLRFYDVAEGTVRLDGIPVRELALDDLRGRVGIVPQDSVIFSANALDNIRYGRPDAPQSRVIAAAKAAHAHGFISELVDAKGRRGYEAQVGERGVKLSGGQRQRIAIARVFLKDAPILVLDEATSALDSEIEAAIQESLGLLVHGKTVIAIAHRLSTIAAMDRLVVMDQGRVVEEGTHAALIRQEGIYADLWARQSGGFLGHDA
jgi:ATP-binding cassette subfamily B protein